MYNDSMQDAVDAFILRRINACGSRTNPALQEAYQTLSVCAERLKEQLSPEQKTLFSACENACALADGETMQCYYRAGFSDAILFLMGWRDEA